MYVVDILLFLLSKCANSKNSKMSKIDNYFYKNAILLSNGSNRRRMSFYFQILMNSGKPNLVPIMLCGGEMNNKMCNK